MVVAQHPVERAQPRDELRARARRHREIDERVDRRSLMPMVARALGVGRLRAEAVEELGPATRCPECEP